MTIDYIKTEIERKIINNEPLTYWEYVKVMNDDSIEIPYMMRVINRDSGEIETKYRPSDYDLPLHQYFTIEILEDDTEITYYTSVYESGKELYYSVDYGLTWNIFEHGDSIDFNRGDKILFYAEYLQFINKINFSTYSSVFALNKTFNVRGNIKTLYCGHNYDQYTIDDNYLPIFNSLFKNQHIIDASKLILSFEQLISYIYEGMFYGCQSLLYGPQIRCHVLVKDSLKSIFEYCTNLKSFQIDSLEFPNEYNGKNWIYNCGSLEKIIINPNASIDWLYYLYNIDYMSDYLEIDLYDLPNDYIYLEYNQNIDIIKIRQDKLWIWVDNSFEDFNETDFNEYEKIYNNIIPNKHYKFSSRWWTDVKHHSVNNISFSKDDFLWYIFDIDKFYVYTGETIEYDDKTWYVFGPPRKFNLNYPDEQSYTNYLMIDSIDFSKENTIRYTKNITSKYNIIKFSRDQNSQSYNLDNILNGSPNTKMWQLYDFGYDVVLPYMKVYITRLHTDYGGSCLVKYSLIENSNNYFYENDKVTETNYYDCDYQVCYGNIDNSLLSNIFNNNDFEYVLVDSIFYNNQILYLWERNNPQQKDNRYWHYLLSNTINFDNEAIALNNKPIFILKYSYYSNSDYSENEFYYTQIINKYFPFRIIGLDNSNNIYDKTSDQYNLVFTKFEGDLYDSAYELIKSNKYLYISNDFYFNFRHLEEYENGYGSCLKFYYIGKITIESTEYYAWKYKLSDFDMCNFGSASGVINENLVLLTKYYDFLNEDPYTKNTSYTTFTNTLNSGEYSKTYIIDGMFISIDNNISGYKSLDEWNSDLIYLYNYSINSTNPLLSWIEIVDIDTIFNVDKNANINDWINAGNNTGEDKDFEINFNSILKYKLVGKSVLNNGEVRYIWKNDDNKICSEFLRFLVTANDTFSKDDMLIYNRNSLYNPVLGFISFNENDYIGYYAYNFNFNYADVHELIDVSTQKLVYYEEYTLSSTIISIHLDKVFNDGSEFNDFVNTEQYGADKVCSLTDETITYNGITYYIWIFNSVLSYDSSQSERIFLLTTTNNFSVGDFIDPIFMSVDMEIDNYNPWWHDKSYDDWMMYKVFNITHENYSPNYIASKLYIEDCTAKESDNNYGYDKIFNYSDYITYNNQDWYLWEYDFDNSYDQSPFWRDPDYCYYLLTQTRTFKPYDRLVNYDFYLLNEDMEEIAYWNVATFNEYIICKIE